MKKLKEEKSIDRISVYEVGPRDGFQNLEDYVPLETKVDIIDKLIATGVKHIQHTSFVSPKAIPQMKDAKELTAICLNKYPDINFQALVPNLRGAEIASEAGVKSISYVVSLSTSHNQANINKTHAESLAGFTEILCAYPDMVVVLDLATAFGCPFEGKSAPEQTVDFLRQYVKAGLKIVNLCDTIGIGDPKQVRDTIRGVQDEYPLLDIMVHIHDTRNMGMVNTLAAIECGVNKVQSTLGGLGGCPFAPGASGNLSTEDLVFMLNKMGYETGIDFDLLTDVAKYQMRKIPKGIFSGHQIMINTGGLKVCVL